MSTGYCVVLRKNNFITAERNLLPYVLKCRANVNCKSLFNIRCALQPGVTRMYSTIKKNRVTDPWVP